MNEASKAMVSMVESYPPESVINLKMESRPYDLAFNTLKARGSDLFYESRTGVLTPSQRELYEGFLKKIGTDLAKILDPIVIAFAVKDACDLSMVDYVWLDLEWGGDVGSCAWVKRKDYDEVFKLTVRLLSRHLEKYILDEYDRRTREDLTRAWEAQMRLPECQVCGTPSPERKLIAVEGGKLRGWSCPACGNQTNLPSDIMELLQGNRVV